MGARWRPNICPGRSWGFLRGYVSKEAWLFARIPEESLHNSPSQRAIRLYAVRGKTVRVRDQEGEPLFGVGGFHETTTGRLDTANQSARYIVG